MKIFASFAVSFCIFFLVFCQTINNNLNPNWSYCFEFTWVGPAYDNTSTFNQTCAEFLDTTRAKHVPCSPPVVITDDGTPPSIDYLFDNHMRSVLCKRTESQVCATYTYRFGGVVDNTTYMCTKVREEGGSALTSGCYTQKVGGYDVELCICKSNPGLYKPCNGKLVTYK